VGRSQTAILKLRGCSTEVAPHMRTGTRFGGRSAPQVRKSLYRRIRRPESTEASKGRFSHFFRVQLENPTALEAIRAVFKSGTATLVSPRFCGRLSP
jgi:hypothetical protein